MEIRILGRDLEVSEIGFGCMGMSHAYGTVSTQKEAEELIEKAIDEGCTFFDTAEIYGTTEDPHHNEKLLGEVLRPYRNKIVLASKCGIRFDETATTVNKPLIPDGRPETIKASIEGSLMRLNTDHLDLYYIHRIDMTVPIEETAGAMKELMEQGKITHWGLSEASEEIIRRAHKVCPVTAIQNRYSMMYRDYEKLFPVLEELKIGFVAFSPLANGLLTAAYHSHFLGINSRYCSILSKYNMGIREWGVLQKMEKLKIHLSEQEIFAYCKIFESNRDFLELNQYASIRKIVNYLAKQIEKEEKGKAYKLSGDVSGISHVEMKCYQTYIRSWKDYIEWAEKLEYDLKSRYVLFPKNFKDVHDKTFLEYQKQQDKMERRKQAKERRTVNQLLKKDIKLLDTKIQDKDYLLKVPENYQEIRKEGQALGHCVGSYIPHIANRECDVYFIRKKTDPDKPFFTVDWRRGKIVQCQGKGRIRYPQEMVEFVHYAEEKLRLLKGEEEKKAA